MNPNEVLPGMVFCVASWVNNWSLYSYDTSSRYLGALKSNDYILVLGSQNHSLHFFDIVVLSRLGCGVMTYPRTEKQNILVSL